MIKTSPIAATSKSALGALLAAFVGAGVIVVTIVLGGGDASAALGALIDGSLVGSYSRSETLLRMTPLLLTGLGVGLAFRGGVWNIGAEGQLYVGALAVTALAPALTALGSVLGITTAILVSFAAGAVWALIAAVMRTRRGVHEVISTIMLNFLAIQFVSWAVHGPLKESTGQFPYSNEIQAALILPRLLPPARLHAGVILALAAAVVTSLLLYRSVWGFHVRVIGASSEAARYAGIPEERTVWAVMAVSGGLAGVAGAVELLGVTHILFESFSPGYGYTAIAVALLGGLRPLLIVPSALLFGALQAGASAMQRQAGVDAVLVYVIQCVVVLTVALRVSRRLRPAAALRARGAEEV